jgi:hypothetical protein
MQKKNRLFKQFQTGDTAVSANWNESKEVPVEQGWNMAASQSPNRAAPFSGLTAAAIAVSSAGAALSLAEGTNRYNRAHPTDFMPSGDSAPVACRDVQGIACRTKYGAPQ